MTIPGGGYGRFRGMLKSGKPGPTQEEQEK
jgi:hypothetical protein